MLGPDEVAAFRAFGFTVARGCLDGTQLATLEHAFARSMADAPAWDQHGTSGSRMLSRLDDADPAFAALAGTPALVAALEAIGYALYLGAFALDNRDDTPWHTTGLPGEGHDTVRASVYLDATNGGEGALCVIAGSHHADFRRRLFDAYGWLEGEGTRLRLPARGAPGAVAVVSRPGDVVLWHTHLWHSAWRRNDGRPRRGLFLTYGADPGDDVVAAARLRRLCNGLGQPHLYGATLRAQASPHVERMAGRLIQLGVANVWPE
jgi:hypothetical protein